MALVNGIKIDPQNKGLESNGVVLTENGQGLETVNMSNNTQQGTNINTINQATNASIEIVAYVSKYKNAVVHFVPKAVSNQIMKEALDSGVVKDGDTAFVKNIQGQEIVGKDGSKREIKADAKNWTDPMVRTFCHEKYKAHYDTHYKVDRKADKALYYVVKLNNFTESQRARFGSVSMGTINGTSQICVVNATQFIDLVRIVLSDSGTPITVRGTVYGKLLLAPKKQKQNTKGETLNTPTKQSTNWISLKYFRTEDQKVVSSMRDIHSSMPTFSVSNYVNTSDNITMDVLDERSQKYIKEVTGIESLQDLGTRKSVKKGDLTNEEFARLKEEELVTFDEVKTVCDTIGITEGMFEQIVRSKQTTSRKNNSAEVMNDNLFVIGYLAQ